MREVDKANVCVWTIVAAVATIVGIIVAVAIGVKTYNSRYDSSAESADAFRADFNRTNNSAAVSLTASAGSIWYGAWQKSGPSNTTYEFYYKQTSAANYSCCIKTLTFSTNGTDGKQGDWRLARSKQSQKYDFKIKRTSNKTKKSKLRVDWAVDSYDSTGF